MLTELKENTKDKGFYVKKLLNFNFQLIVRSSIFCMTLLQQKREIFLSLFLLLQL